MFPYLHEYLEPKKQKAYERYLKGESQRKVCEKLKIPRSTFRLWSQKDGWEAERKARRMSASEQAVTAANGPQGGPTGPTGSPVDQPPAETRMQGMERMLARQQRLVGKLLTAYEADLERTMTDPAKQSRSQIAQLTTLGQTLLAMERKAWCVPDKIETKDMTPQKVDEVRKLTDEELDRRITEATRGTTPPPGREAAEASIN